MAYSILIVDDEEIILNSEGYEVEEADDGDTAFEIISQKSFDLVITDIKMPKMDGISLLRKISNLQPETFFIIITAFASTETAINALRLGAYDYITKPLEFDDSSVAIDVMDKVGPGGNFLMEEHTLRNFKEKFWFPRFLDRNMFDMWEGAGSKNLREVLNEKAREIFEKEGAAVLSVEAGEKIKELVKSHKPDV